MLFLHLITDAYNSPFPWLGTNYVQDILEGKTTWSFHRTSPETGSGESLQQTETQMLPLLSNISFYNTSFNVFLIKLHIAFLPKLLEEMCTDQKDQCKQSLSPVSAVSSNTESFFSWLKSNMAETAEI